MFEADGFWTYLQRQEIRQGKEEGLSEEEIAVYRKPSLNYLQMASLRNALCSGISAESVRPLAHSWIPHWQMEDLIQEIRNGGAPVLPKRPFPLKQVIAGVLVLLGGVGIVLTVDPSESPVLELTAQEVRLACGMEFDPSLYVKDYSRENASLYLPDRFVAEKPGTRLVQYRLEGKGGSVHKNLRILVVDETAPTITLKTEKTELLKEAPFACHSFVLSVADNVDRDLAGSVSCSDMLLDQASQKVEYRVKDRAGNIGTAFLEVHYADFEPEEDETETTPTPKTEAVMNTEPAQSIRTAYTPNDEPVSAPPAAEPEPAAAEEEPAEETPLLQ